MLKKNNILIPTQNANTVTSNNTKSNDTGSVPTAIPSAQTATSYITQSEPPKGNNRRCCSKKDVTTPVTDHTLSTDIKATFSFHKLIPKNAQMTTLYTNWPLYITFTMIYYIRQEYFFPYKQLSGRNGDHE